MPKNHYRKVYKSDHLGVVDLEEFLERGSDLCFTISHTVQGKQKVMGRSIECNVVYFCEKIKPMVVNATNGKQIAKFANSGFVEDWKNIRVQLYIDKSVKMKGEVTGGIRIRPQQPKEKEFLNPNHPQWSVALERVKGGADRGFIEQYYSIDEENWGLLCQ